MTHLIPLLLLFLPLLTTATPCSIPYSGWSISQLRFHSSYIFSTPSHQNSWGYVDFNATALIPPATLPVSPNAAGFDARACRASSSRLNDFFYGTPAYRCSPAPEPPEDALNPKAGCAAPLADGALEFTFSRPTGDLALNQTWLCNGTPVSMLGNVSVALDCHETYWENPKWKLGQFWSTRTVECTPLDVFVQGKLA